MQPRKNLILVLALLVGCLMVAQGCRNPSGQRAAYNTIATVQDAVDGAYDAYFEQVALDLIPTNDLPAVSKALNVEHAAALVAINQLGSTNALSPVYLTHSAEDVLNLLMRVYASYGKEPPKKVTKNAVLRKEEE